MKTILCYLFFSETLKKKRAKKHKKHKVKEVNPSSGDSASEAHADDIPPHPPGRNEVCNAVAAEPSTSGGDADAETDQKESKTSDKSSNSKVNADACYFTWSYFGASCFNFK